MSDEKYPTDGVAKGRKWLRRRQARGNECDKDQIEENKRIEKDKIIDEEEDEEKEEEDEVAKYSKKNR